MAATLAWACSSMISRTVKLGAGFCPVNETRQKGQILLGRWEVQSEHSVCPHGSAIALLSVSKSKRSRHTGQSHEDAIVISVVTTVIDRSP